jgi:hypothetical protein
VQEQIMRKNWNDQQRKKKGGGTMEAKHRFATKTIPSVTRECHHIHERVVAVICFVCALCFKETNLIKSNYGQHHSYRHPDTPGSSHQAVILAISQQTNLFSRVQEKDLDSRLCQTMWKGNQRKLTIDVLTNHCELQIASSRVSLLHSVLGAQ